MKKLVLFAVAAVAISFASCGNKAAENAAENADSVQTQVQEVAPVADTTAVVDSAAVVK